MPAEPFWERLTAPSKAALRWAWASAIIRGGPETSVNPFDLLAGILLADVEHSEPRQLFRHFHIPLGAALGPAGVRLRPDELHAAVRGLPEGTPPPLDEVANRILDHALEEMPNPEPDGGLVPLSVLFGAWLEQTGRDSFAIAPEFVLRGVDFRAVVDSYRDYLLTRQPYRAFLEERHPFTHVPVEVPHYHVDQPESDDLIGIAAEVDAFAYLIASRALRPPLAVGLFGDWGSGKSFFLHSLKRRIAALVNNPAAQDRESPFYRHIAQVEFNAWQYVEGDLWASLVEHLFRNLCTSSGEDPNLLGRLQGQIIAQLEKAGEERDALRLQQVTLEEKRRVAAAQVDHRRYERDLRLADLERQRSKNLLAVMDLPAVHEAARLAGLSEFDDQAAQVADALAEARDLLRQANPLLAPLRAGKLRYTLAVIALVLLIPAAAAGLERFGVPAFVASVTPILASATAYLRLGTHRIRRGLDRIAEEQHTLNAKVSEAQEQLDEVERQLTEAIVAERDLASQAAKLEVKLAETTPSSVLADFLTERSGSDDYRRLLGIPALIRRDLERLSKAIDELNRTGGSDGGNLAVNRIVLYIDDLDRCPEERVIEVLQAVHLLLAFPLFVVVVAVDARWLVGSLKARYGELLSEGASPADYLEKIFQVPFWVEPLGPDVRQRMARGLLEPSLAAPSAPAAEPSTVSMDSDDIGTVDDRFYRLVEEFSRIEMADPGLLEATRLTVSEEELALIDEVAPLLGATPRSVKRFVNVYQLVKSIDRHRSGTGDDDGSLPIHACVILLLAISTGLPDLARDLFPAIEQHPDQLLPKVVNDLVPLDKGAAAQRGRLTAWLDAHPDWPDPDLTHLRQWLPLIRRFSFRSG